MARSSARSGSPFEESIGFSRAVRVGDRILVSGTAPVWPDGSCHPDAGAQAARCLEIIAHSLVTLGSSLDDVVRTRMFLVTAGDAAAVGRVHAAAFDKARPAATMVVIASLLDPRWRVEIEAEAIVGAGAGTPESGTPESGTPASGTPASGTPESGTPASGTPESGTPESGTPE
jgi:enamine deaminase RidA (YjgF/YER057c/UK114 family)